ncbi:MAG: ribonuclease HII [Rhodovibrionaceae bacterium]
MLAFDFETDSGAGEGRIVLGVDEAGRGPLAGPVVAAAVWLDPEKARSGAYLGVRDSKQLCQAERRELFAILRVEAKVAVGVAESSEIDSINILQASLLAMRRAVAGLGLQAASALVDGNVDPRLDCPVRTVVGGDGLCLSIAAASIVAKETRDALMEELAETFPGYGWERNRGYGTAEHQAAIRRLGVTPQHRRSFRPIREALELSL